MSDSLLPAAPRPPALASTPGAPVLRGNRCQCTGCGDFFNSTSTFDRHRTGRFDVPGDRRCLSGNELIARGWSRNTARLWIERTMRSTATGMFRGGRGAASPNPLGGRATDEHS